MAYNKILDPTKFFEDDGRNYFGHKASAIPKLQVVQVEGPVAELVEQYRTDGESVTVLESYKPPIDGRNHTVAWIGRRGVDGLVGEAFETYQLICDCLPDAPDDLRDEALFTCRGVSQALSARAFLIRERLGNSQVLYGRYNEQGMPKKGAKLVLRDMISFMLDQVHYHPYAWQANTASGTQLVRSLAGILEADPDRTRKIVKKMAKKGEVELYGGEIVRKVLPKAA